jgi:Peptidase family S41
MGPIGQSDSSRQAAILRDIARLRNSTDSQTGIGIGCRSCVALCRGGRSFIDNDSCGSMDHAITDHRLCCAVARLASCRTTRTRSEFAYDVQNLKRATLVGEVTGGGANPGGPEKVHSNFMVNVPRGRAISPVTKTNWEGTGVKPDVAVAADKALDTAYLAALEKVKATIDSKKRPGMAKEIDDAIAKLKSAAK